MARLATTLTPGIKDARDGIGDVRPFVTVNITTKCTFTAVAGWHYAR